MEMQSKEELLTLLNNEKKLVLIDFFATWCGPCRMLSPVLEQVASELSASLVAVKVDVDKHPDLTRQFNINAMPTLVFYQDGHEVGRQTGYMSADDLMDLISQIKK